MTTCQPPCGNYKIVKYIVVWVFRRPLDGSSDQVQIVCAPRTLFKSSDTMLFYGVCREMIIREDPSDWYLLVQYGARGVRSGHQSMNKIGSGRDFVSNSFKVLLSECWGYQQAPWAAQHEPTK